MKIHELPADPGARQKRKRIGRGESSGRGKTAGQGHKGSQARSGAKKGKNFEGGQMPLMRRLPKFGFTNLFRTAYEAVNVSALAHKFEAGATVDIEAMRAAGLVRGKGPVKVLGDGDLGKALHVSAHKFSQSAGEKISNAGGTLTLIPLKPAPVAKEGDAS
jgi:large subunit ribosomal protein L15